MNKEVKNLVRCMALFLKDTGKILLHSNHSLLPWLVLHCGWCISVYKVRSDGRSGSERLKGRPYSGKIAMFGERVWYKTPDASSLTSLEERWTTCIWLGQTHKSDEHIVALGNEVKLVRARARGGTASCSRAHSALRGSPGWSLARPRRGRSGTSPKPSWPSTIRLRSARRAWARQ